jgi:hypothetical protein
MHACSHPLGIRSASASRLVFLLLLTCARLAVWTVLGASGFGWELGKAGLLEYVQPKTIVAAEHGRSWNWYL